MLAYRQWVKLAYKKHQVAKSIVAHDMDPTNLKSMESPTQSRNPYDAAFDQETHS